MFKRSWMQVLDVLIWNQLYDYVSFIGERQSNQFVQLVPAVLARTAILRFHKRSDITKFGMVVNYGRGIISPVVYFARKTRASKDCSNTT